MKLIYLIATAVAVANAASVLPTNSKSCIDGCKCEEKSTRRLQIIECDGPLILNNATFKDINTKEINVLSIENVIINEIHETAFKDFKNLGDVLIINAKIGSIDANAFNNVLRLKFAQCGFEDDPDLVSEKLEELHFGDCRLEEIPELDGLLSLTFLNLSGNYIKNVEIDTFAQLFDLEELYLSDNEIFKLPPTLFINNQQLNTLHLDNNPLKHFYLNTTGNLETLSLKNCQLEVFDEKSTQKLSTLNELVLSHNNIRTINSKTFANMHDLSFINLAFNKLEKLDDDIFSQNQNLIQITLDGNNFTTLPNFYLENGNIFSIYTFSCKSCGLTSLSGSVFQNMASMITLKLSYNKFTNVDELFDKIESLKTLDISYNNISKFSVKTFSNNRNLETLIIAGNPLGMLDPEAFLNNRVLREIDARNASLKQLWTSTDYHIDYLRKLLIGDNLLKNLTLKDFQVTPVLEAIHLTNNPLVFNSQLCKVLRRLRATEVAPIDNVRNVDDMCDSKLLGEDIDGFTTIEWKDFYQDKCPNIKDATNSDYYYYDSNETDNYDDDDEEEEEEEEDENYDDSYDDDSEEVDNVLEETLKDKLCKWPFGASSERDANSSLARASYILSITSVFVLSALVVLTIIVTLTLCILRRNKNFNMHTANLPRFKIPLWNTQSCQKKHSGSVYRPLSEDLSGPKTPKLNRYEFTAAPTVHSSNH